MNKKLNLIIAMGVLAIGLTGCSYSSTKGIDCSHITPCQNIEIHDALKAGDYDSSNNTRYSNNGKVYTRESSTYDRERQDYSQTNERYSYIESNTSNATQYKVMSGSYKNKKNANDDVYELRWENIGSYISECVVNGETMYRVVTGQFSNEYNAQQQCDMLKGLGYDAFVIKEDNN